MFLRFFLGVDPWLLGSVFSQGQGALGSIPPGGLGLTLGTYIELKHESAGVKSSFLVICTDGD